MEKTPKVGVLSTRKTQAHKATLSLIQQLKNRAIVWKKRRNMRVLRTSKTLAHKVKLCSILQLKNRAVVWKKPRNMKVIRTSKTLAHKVKLWSILWLKNRAVIWKNAAIKKIRLKVGWLTIPPPGGGRPKPRKFTISNTKKAKFSFPLPQVTKIGNTLSVEILLVASYCSVLEKSWAGSWNKYTKLYRAQHSQLRKVKAVTPPQVIIESKSLENTNKVKQKNKLQSKLKGFKKRKKFSSFQVTIMV